MNFTKGLVIVGAVQAALGVLPAEAVVRRYLVRVHSDVVAGATRRELHQMRQARLDSLSAELSSTLNTPVQVASAPHLGFLVVQGESDDLEPVLASHHAVEYYENDQRWRLAEVPTSAPTPMPNSSAGVTGNPAGQSMSPWMSDILGLKAENPPAVVNADGSAVVVGVVDTGMSLGHPYFESGVATQGLAGANVLLHSNDVSEVDTDHGSHVAGLVKAVRDQAATLYPQAKNVEILPVRFIGTDGSGSTSAAVLGLEYAAGQGAKVINASWGAGGRLSFSQALYDAMVSLYVEDDVVLAVAAGNADSQGPNNNDLNPYFPSSFSIPSLISVASLTPSYNGDGQKNVHLTSVALSEFSNYGTANVHIAAPGDCNNPNVSAPGLFSANAHFNSENDLYIQKRGTSMATPLVAGVAAVIRSINPSLTAFEVRKIILDQVHKSTSLSMISSSGWLDAAASFKASVGAVSHGLKPAVPAQAYSTESASVSTDSSSGGGGCGALRSIGAGGPGFGGPWGGNSLGLFSSLYFAGLLVRKLRTRILRKIGMGY